MSTPPQSTLESALRQTRAETGLPLNELRILMGCVTGLDRVGLLTKGEQPLPPDQITAFKTLASKRQQGHPIAYLVEHKEFYSRSFFVDPRVLIPRPETEELVEHALGFLQSKSTENLLTRVLDIGCGSGAIAISLALENPILEVTATDISVDALWVAQFNANELGAKNVRFIQSDLFSGLLNQTPALAFDLICSNPPYIEQGDKHLAQGDLRFEPAIALTDGGDGLHFYREIARQSPTLLRAGGGVLVEHGYNQQEAVLAIFSQPPYTQVQGLPDLAGTPRFVFARA
ncbi:[protein release factor]-glutamine N5-methyltransferase [Limnobacter thiooxidans]|uniref:Release factor glutamine methyltransferase n=1 Tax=Limnobacter thiooxidans TaxID=131080 RepID=A0AA86JID4_9BURK|nr:peptide chain release factor N(5)-glutamine methyltransferase [Limnobacter sp.]MCZ8016951.1 peptide chain release factor N(5)-glutamine methyltransferase [Limnobacter sp.]RZS38672.1 [protein release factor]-glutamine N5-methyltransferase [Limnobacter thiooxidans]BET24877.1 peptide chain release factor N(5)-glutamine methyltransferase [Limnobacter thiooxidans]